MFCAQLVIAVILGFKVTDTSENLNSGFAMLVVIMICTFVSAFAWSWGPLGWLIPSETFPLETRSAGQSITVCINLVFTFIIAQVFLSMLCHFKYGIFLFFSGWVLVMSIFVWFLVPETKNIPIEEMTERVWKQHWLWKRFMDDDEYSKNDLDKKNGQPLMKPLVTRGFTTVGIEELPAIEGGWGWRVYLGLAGISALLLTVGALLVVDTPNSLIERGKLEEGKAVLIKIRGTENIEPEYLELVAASRIAKEGFKNDASLYSTVITGAVNVLSTIVGIYSVDKVGRRFLLLQAGVQMLCAQLVIAVILGFKVTDTSENLNSGFAMLVVIMICTFVSAFAWSWVPLGWLIPSETFPLETRSAGQSITVCINLVFTFIIAQVFLSMLCHFKYGIFLFFLGWVLVMSIFVWFLVPEIKNIPIEEMTERV
nr:sugar transport protein 13 [Tanacetum cinerariifolium]